MRRRLHFAFASLVLGGCYCSHVPDADAGTDAGGPRVDAGVDAGWDAGDWDGAAVCTPPLEWRVDRFPDDSQAQRDENRVFMALFRSCGLGEDCASVVLFVDELGVVVRVGAVDPGGVVEGCARDAVLGLCLPSFAGRDDGQEITACGI